jgi:predicted nuclease with TOPRIM domain
MFIDMDEKYQVNSSTLYSAFLRRGVDALQTIEAEIRREKAEALGRAVERLEQALNDLEGVNEMIARIEGCLRDSSSLPEETATLRQAHANLKARLAVLRDRARLAHEYLLIQREAVGVRSHLDVERCYRVSERLG